MRIFVVPLLLFGALFAQTPYYGPNAPPHFEQPTLRQKLYQVQIAIYDDPKPGGVKIQEVVFNGQVVALKPPDIHGFRGGGSFQLQAGSYTLSWRVLRDSFSWPRTMKYDQDIQVQPRDAWLQVTIEGEKATTL